MNLQETSPKIKEKPKFIVIVQGEEKAVRLPDPLAKGRSNPGYASELVDKADQLARKNPKKALQGYINALKFDPGNVKIWNKAGDLAYKQKEWDKAIPLFKKALFLKEKSSNPLNQVGILYRLARTFSQKKDFKTAIIYKNRELAIEQKKGRLKRVAAIYGDLGYYYRNSKQKAKAEDFFRKGISVAKKNADLLTAAYQYIPLGFLVLENKTNIQSCTMWQKAQKIFMDKKKAGRIKEIDGYLKKYKCI